ncbi:MULTISPECIES: hypothetical protein [Rheinheimera]|uniref:Lipoprotein n=1 Tax=Rheinheimera marina TaxID=1774958 RepID=A0ABV9JPX7_9GAMM
MKKGVVAVVLGLLFSSLLGCASVQMEVQVADDIPPTDCYPISSF